MNALLLLGVVIGVVSFGGAAFLLSIWHEDHASGTRGWPLSRVLAYLAIAGTLASNFLGLMSLLRITEYPNFREIQLALTPLYIVALVILDSLFTILALYLRGVRATGYVTASERSELATEASVQEAIAAAREANRQIAALAEAMKEDKP